MCLGRLQLTLPLCTVEVKCVFAVPRWLSPSSRSLFSVYVHVLVKPAWWWPIYTVETSSQAINRSPTVCCVWLTGSIDTRYAGYTNRDGPNKGFSAVTSTPRDIVPQCVVPPCSSDSCILVQTGSCHWYFLINGGDVYLRFCAAGCSVHPAGFCLVNEAEPALENYIFSKKQEEKSQVAVVCCVLYYITIHNVIFHFPRGCYRTAPNADHSLRTLLWLHLYIEHVKCWNVNMKHIRLMFKLGSLCHSTTWTAFCSVVRDREGRFLDTSHSDFGGSRFELQSGQWIFYVFRRFGLKQYFKT
jgi:hypothetical protein